MGLESDLEEQAWAQPLVSLGLCFPTDKWRKPLRGQGDNNGGNAEQRSQRRRSCREGNGGVRKFQRRGHTSVIEEHCIS